MGFGFIIKELLRNRKMTIKQLAEETDIPVNTLYSITKRDSTRVDPVIVSRILNALDVTMGELFDMNPDDDDENRFSAFDEGLSSVFGSGWAFSNDASKQIRIALDGFANFETKEEELLFFFERMNAHGQEVALKNIRIIAGNPDCQRTEPLKPSTVKESKKGETIPRKQEKPPEGDITPPDGK